MQTGRGGRYPKDRQEKAIVGRVADIFFEVTARKPRKMGPPPPPPPPQDLWRESWMAGKDAARLGLDLLCGSAAVTAFLGKGSDLFFCFFGEFPELVFETQFLNQFFAALFGIKTTRFFPELLKDEFR